MTPRQVSLLQIRNSALAALYPKLASMVSLLSSLFISQGMLCLSDFHSGFFRLDFGTKLCHVDSYGQLDLTIVFGCVPCQE